MKFIKKRKISTYQKSRRFNRNYLLLIILFSILLNVSFVRANFVCGEVFNSEGNMSASWFNVRIFYPENKNLFTSCYISPAGNKYCCDTEAIPGRTWKIGDVIGAEIFDNQTGYIAGPVSVVTTGEGYSVFPQMKLDKVIKVYSPDKKLYFSNNSLIFINASFSFLYNNVFIDKDGNKSVLCYNCSSFSNNLNANFGMNYFDLIASSGERSIDEKINFAILNYFNFNRKLDCKNCKKNRVKSGSEVKMSLILNISNDVSELELKEYVPVDWEILDSNSGEVNPYSSTHNEIIWKVSGKNIIKNYSVRPPNAGLLNNNYVFRTYLEDEILSEENITVYRFFPFFSLNQKILSHQITKTVQSRIYPDKPLVIRLSNEYLMKLAIFPKKEIKNAEFSIIKNISFYKIGNAIDYYFFDTNLEPNYIEKIYVEFKVDKKNLDKNNYKNISLFILVNGNWQKTNVEKFNEDEKNFYYSAYINSTKGIAIAGVKEKRFLDFFKYFQLDNVFL